jgi:hypothetical protein
MARLSIGTPPQRPDLSSGGFMSLVDILLATIGIFLIVFAMQSLAEVRRLQPAPYDGIISCDAEERITLDLRGPGGTMTRSDLPKGDILPLFRALLSDGGRFLVASDPLCLIDSAADSAASQLARLDGELSLLADPDTTHQFEYVPLGPAPDDIAGLRRRWMGPQDD